MPVLAKFYQDGIYYPAVIGERHENGYLVKFIGYEDDEWQPTRIEDIIGSAEDKVTCQSNTPGSVQASAASVSLHRTQQHLPTKLPAESAKGITRGASVTKSNSVKYETPQKLSHNSMSKEAETNSLVNRATVNGLIQILRQDWIGQKRYVSVPLLVQEVNLRLGVSKFEHLGVGGIHDVDALRQLGELEDFVNTFITCFLFKTCMCTLHELETRLAAAKSVKSFDELRIGPLLKHPLIVREFQPSSHVVSIPNISFLDCARALAEILRSRKDFGKMIEPKQIVENLMASRNVSDPHELCVRIKGIGLYIAQLISCGKSESLELREIKTRLQQEEHQRIADLSREMCNAMEKRFKQACCDEITFEAKLCEILGSKVWDDDGCIQLFSVLQFIKKNMKPLLPILSEPEKERKNLKKLDKQLQKHFPLLLAFLNENPIGRALADILLCRSSQNTLDTVHSGYGMERNLFPRVGSIGRDGEGSLAASRGNTSVLHCSEVRSDTVPSEAFPSDPPALSEVADSLSLELRNVGRAISLGTLADVEQHVAEKFGKAAFDSLGYGSFLRLLADESQLARIIDDKLMHSGVDAHMAEATKVIAQAQKMMCNMAIDSEEERTSFLRRALSIHYQLPADQIDQLVEQGRKLAEDEPGQISDQTTPFLYSCLVLATEVDPECFKIEDDLLAGKAAAKLLVNAPFLFDLARWTRWRAVFEPILGTLDDFLVEHTELGISTVKLPNGGGVIKINPSSSCETFRAAVAGLHANAAAIEILSIMCLHDGVLTSPLSLLKASAVAGLEAAILRAGKDCAVKFALETARALPDCFRHSIVARFLIDPLTEAVGCGQSKCHELVIQMANNDPELQCILRDLGMCDRISLWTADWIAAFTECSEESSIDRNCNIPAVGDEPMDIISNKSDSCAAFVVGTLPPLSACDPSAHEHMAEIAIHARLSESDISQAQLVVQEIRKKEFGIGLELDGSGTDLRESLNARIGRALDRLSNELYSSDSHFLLELIQNADDNSYPIDVIPELYFVKSDRYVVVGNNECGFTERDVRALSDIGKSTKSKRSGYIGQKGIGFKSVFRVTNAPQIHSNGYSIVFDTNKYGPLGYILPEWVGHDGLSQLLKGDSDIGRELAQWTTVIALPSKSATPITACDLFEDLSPSLLLFLRQLKRISVFDPVAQKSRIFQRVELGQGVVQLSCNEQSFKFLTATKSFAPQVHRLDVQVESTDVTIAIPLPDDLDKMLQQQPAQHVFAYLPVRPFGFRFIVQGDFILPSSRESIDRDSPWNQRLRAEIPAAFALAVSVCISMVLLDDPVRSANLWLSMLPLEVEVEGFFKPCVRAIYAAVRTMDCILTKELQLVSPLHAVICPKKMSTLVDADMLKKFLNLHSAHTDLLRKPLAALGVLEVGLGVIIGLLKARAFQTLDQISGVLYYIADCLAADRLTIEEQRMLSTLPLLMLMDGSITSADGGSVYIFPAGKRGEGITEIAIAASLELSTFIRILHPDVDNRKDGGDSRNLARLLAMIGVKNLSLQQIMKQHVIEEFNKPVSAQTSENFLDSLLAFSCRYWIAQTSAEKQDIIGLLKDCALVSTNHGLKKINDGAIHLIQDYDNPLDSALFQAMISLDWTFVSGKYLSRFAIPRGDWRIFFKALGITDFISVTSRQIQPKSSDEICEWDMNSLGIEFASDIKITDFKSAELEDLFRQVATVAGGQRIMMQVAHYFNDHWECYENYRFAFIGGCSEKVPSSFLLCLMRTSWLPNSESGILNVPSSLWHFSPSVRAVFGTLDVPHIDSRLNNESFLQDIGVKTSPAIRTVLEELHCWSTKSSFRARMEDIVSIYSYLSEPFRQDLRPSQLPDRPKHAKVLMDEIRQQFRDNSLIFVPHKMGDLSRKTEGHQVGGRFYPLSDLRFFDQTRVIEGILDLPIRVIGSYYKSDHFNSHRFFVETLRDGAAAGVEEIPSFDDYVAALKIISATMAPTAEQLNHCYAVFSVWSNAVAEGDITPEDWRQKLSGLQKLPLFPTVCGKWSTLQRGVYINDDETFAALFKDVSGILFLRSNYGKSSLTSFFHEQCNVALLSQSIERRIVSIGSNYGTKLSVMVQKLFPWMQRWIFWNCFDRYEQIANTIEPRLDHFQTVLCHSLEQMISLNGEERPAPAGHAAMDGNIFYVAKASAEKYLEIFVELSRFFFNGVFNNEFALFAASLITSLVNGVEPESLLERFALHPLFPSCPQAESLSIPLIEWNVRLVNEMLNSIDCSMHRPNDDTVEDEADSRKGQTKKREPLAAWPPPLPLRTSGITSHARCKDAAVDGSERALKETDSDCASATHSSAASISDAVSKDSSNCMRSAQVREACKEHAGVPDQNCSRPAASTREIADLISGSPESVECQRNGGFHDQATADLGSHPHVESSDGTSHLYSSPSAEVPAASDLTRHRNGTFAANDKSVGDVTPEADADNDASITEFELDSLEVQTVLEGFSPGFASEASMSKSGLSPDKLEKLGRYGEALVVRHLRSLHSKDDMKVEWMNEQGESGAPYDISIMVRGPTGDVLRTDYIEVKTTGAQDKDFLFVRSPYLS